MLRIITVKVEEDLINRLDRVVRELGYKSRSELIREALEFYLKMIDLRVKKYSDYVESIVI